MKKIVRSLILLSLTVFSGLAYSQFHTYKIEEIGWSINLPDGFRETEKTSLFTGDEKIAFQGKNDTDFIIFHRKLNSERNTLSELEIKELNNLFVEEIKRKTDPKAHIDITTSEKKTDSITLYKTVLNIYSEKYAIPISYVIYSAIRDRYLIQFMIFFTYSAFEANELMDAIESSKFTR